MPQQTATSPYQQAARGLSRRASFAAVSVTGLATLATPLAGEAKKKKKCKKGKKCPSLEELCAPQVDECIATINALCPPAGDCSRIVDCCEGFATCDVSAFALCLATPA